MTRQNTFEAALDAADQRVHEAREALRVAQQARTAAEDALNRSRVPGDVKAYMERVAAANRLTPEEHAERDAAQKAYDAAVAAEAPVRAEIAKLFRGIDPKDGSEPIERYGPRDKADDERDQRIKTAKRELEHELGSLREVTQRALVTLRAVIQRTDSARQERRRAVKDAWRLAQEAKRPPPVVRATSFEFLSSLIHPKQATR